MQKRLPKAERREQLLETALEIVRDEGTDALTLGYLAERAGISKPIAYTHFTTRSGLLIALALKVDDQHLAVYLDAVKQAPRRLKDVARVASSAYMHCFTTLGPEWHAISAALKGDVEMESFQQKLIDRYAGVFYDVFASYSDLPKTELQLRCVGIIGAADAISRNMILGRIDESTAATAMASLIIKWLG